MKNKPTNDLPMFRVSFSRITGKDDNGKPILSRPREIGAIWQRRNGKAGGILELDVIPVELSQRQGVIFIVPPDERSER